MAAKKPEDQKPKPTPTRTHAAPEGYQSQSDDIVGTWNPEDGEPIHGIPRHVKLSDSGIDKRNTSVLVFFELIDPCKVRDRPSDAQEEGEIITADPGDIVGVWYKAGMRKLLNLGQVNVFMYLSGEKDVGKPSPMKTFDIQAPRRGQRLRVDEDNRKESQQQTIFDTPGTKRPMQQQDMSVPNDADGNPMF
jgi:hypothetical protein